MNPILPPFRPTPCRSPPATDAACGQTHEEQATNVAALLPWSYTYGMPRGNPSPKLAITVDPDVHDRVVSAAAQEGISVSAWMTEAARRALVVRDGLAAVSEWERLNGPFTPDEMASARQRVAKELATPRKRSS
jgi:hypothetical protein